MAAKLFFSYSHEDESYRDQLEKHLAMLKHQGLIEPWHDRRILAGQDLDTAIDVELDRADVVLLLVSASFVASQYCYSKEMERAMQRHLEGSATIIPVIVRECDWTSAPFGRLKAVPKDGKAIASWPNLDAAYADVAREVRAVVERLSHSTVLRSQPKPNEVVASAALSRSSNLRLRKEFSDLEADRFLADAFDYIARFFEGSLNELGARNPGVDGRFERVDGRTFVAAIYKNGKRTSECAITLGGGGFRSAGISFSFDASARGNSYNERVSVEADDQVLFLRPFGMASRGGQQGDKLSPEGAAELFWGLLMQRLQ